MLIESYLPKPALDYITGRMTELMKRRPMDSTTDMPHASATATATATVDGDPF
jgi:hypothetical protein